jgi:hypothetical protein
MKWNWNEVYGTFCLSVIPRYLGELFTSCKVSTLAQIAEDMEEQNLPFIICHCGPWVTAISVHSSFMGLSTSYFNNKGTPCPYRAYVCLVRSYCSTRGEGTSVTSQSSYHSLHQSWCWLMFLAPSPALGIILVQTSRWEGREQTGPRLVTSLEETPQM